MLELIDRQAALRLCIEGDGYDDEGFTEGYNFAVSEIREGLKTVPTIEAEPIWHGRWENPTESKPRMFERNGHTFTERQCSECKRWNISVTGSIMCKYCPHCGAMMNGGADDGKM